MGSEGAKTGPFGAGDTLVQVLALDGTLLAASPGTPPIVLTPAQQARALAGELSFTGSVGGDRDRILATTAATGRGRLLIVVGTGTDVSDAAVDQALNALIVGGPVAVLLAGLGAWLLAGAALRPVERMRSEAAGIGDRDLGRRRAVLATRDEIAALGATMNDLLARLQEALACGPAPPPPAQPHAVDAIDAVVPDRRDAAGRDVSRPSATRRRPE